VDGIAEYSRQTFQHANESIDEARNSKNELLADLRKATIRIAPYANVRRIPNNKLDKLRFDDSFEYYIADFSMNINVPIGKIKALRFILTIIGDGKQSENVYVLSGFPNNLIEHVTIIKGKIKVCLSELLKIIPHPVPMVLGKVVQIDLDPWEIDWGYNKIKVRFGGGNNHMVDWRLHSKDLNLGFACSIILKKRPSVKNVTAIAQAKWVYEPEAEGLRGFLKRAFGTDKIEPDSGTETIRVLSSPIRTTLKKRRKERI
jgi:hypothetical protein